MLWLLSPKTFCIKVRDKKAVTLEGTKSSTLYISVLSRWTPWQCTYNWIQNFFFPIEGVLKSSGQRIGRTQFPRTISLMRTSRQIPRLWGIMYFHGETVYPRAGNRASQTKGKVSTFRPVDHRIWFEEWPNRCEPWSFQTVNILKQFLLRKISDFGVLTTAQNTKMAETHITNSIKWLLRSQLSSDLFPGRLVEQSSTKIKFFISI